MPNKSWLKKKRILIITLGIIILFLLFYFGRLFTMYQKNDINAGWRYHFLVKSILNTPLITILEKKCINEKGSFHAGKYYAIPTGENLGYQAYCDVSYSDYEKVCHNPDDCLGDCVFNDELPSLSCVMTNGVPKRNHYSSDYQKDAKTVYYNCSALMSGTCSKEGLGESYTVCNEDGWQEVDDNLIIDHVSRKCIY